MAKINVALCITELYIGGAERCLVEIARRIDKSRFAPVVYCLGPQPTPDEESFLPALEAAGVEVHCLDGRRVWQFPVVAARLKRLLAAQKPHVVQTFLFHANILGRIAARRANVPAVVCGVRVAERAATWHLWLDRITQRYVDRYVCVSRSVADFSTSAGGLPSEKIVVIPNGIDVADFANRPAANLAELGVAAGRRLVTFVGRLEPQKGVAWLVETAPRWLTKLPDCDLLLVGDGPLKNRLKKAASDAGIAQRVHFAGRRRDVPEILAASKLLVLPSMWEGMPNVVLEAMAAALPVVATDVEGVAELLGTAAPRQTVRRNDADDFAAKILGFMQSSTEAAALGAENRRRAEEKFSISHMVAAYEELWESLVH